MYWKICILFICSLWQNTGLNFKRSIDSEVGACSLTLLTSAYPFRFVYYSVPFLSSFIPAFWRHGLKFPAGFVSFSSVPCLHELLLHLCSCCFALCLLAAPFPSVTAPVCPSLRDGSLSCLVLLTSSLSPRIATLSLLFSFFSWYVCPPTIVSLLVWHFVLNVFLVKSCCSISLF